MDTTLLTDQVREAESRNTDSICIYFDGDGSPAAFGESAVRLHRHFPELPLREIPSGGGSVTRAIRGFSLEAVIEKFRGNHRMLVDDYHVQIMDIQ